MSTPVSEDLLRRIWAEYTEMPGLSLTVYQGQRLWSLDALTCACALDQLAASGVLRKTVSGQYRRASDGRTGLPSLRMARVDALPAANTPLRQQARRNVT